MSGCFITFEGVEGSGKTTQMRLLSDWLEEHGRSCVLTREPGGVTIAEAIRDLLLDPRHHNLAPLAELLLYEAARAQHVAELIRPALEAGQVVLCDRFTDSTVAYQGAGRALPNELVAQLNLIASDGIMPHQTFLLDLPAEKGLQRTRSRGRADRLEQESLAFHERVRESFLRIAEKASRRVTIVDGSQGPEAVAADVRKALSRMLQETREDERGVSDTAPLS